MDHLRKPLLQEPTLPEVSNSADNRNKTRKAIFVQRKKKQTHSRATGMNESRELVSDLHSRYGCYIRRQGADILGSKADTSAVQRPPQEQHHSAFQRFPG